MATWFAQTYGANINSANMWNSLPAGGGTVLTWPPATNDILVCNGRNVLVNVNTTVAELQNDTRSGATIGGQFRMNTNGVSLVANAYNSWGNGAGIVAVTLSSGTVYFVGNVYGGSVTASNGFFLGVGIGATVNFTGNCYAGAGTNAVGFQTASTHTGIVNFTGNTYGNDGGNAPGLIHNTSGTVTVTGNAIAGNFIAGYGAALNSAGANLTITGYAQASALSSAVQNVAQGVLTIGETRSASNGRGAVDGALRFASATAAVSKPIIAGTQKTLSVLDVAALVPAVEYVRAGVVYGDGAYTGTLSLLRKRQTMAGRF